MTALVLLLFRPVLRCGFVNYDDDIYVTANPHVQQGLTALNFAWSFRTETADNWHPLTWLSLMLDAQWSGRQAFGFHLTNLLFHVANAVLLFLILYQMTGARWRSALVAALFALHPLHVESVAWVAERKDVLSGWFFMLTLLAYARYARVMPIHKGRMETAPSNAHSSSGIRHFRSPYYWLAVFFFACGLMSKPMLVTLPFVLLLLDFWPLQRFHRSTLRRLVLEKLPFFVLTAISCIITFIAQKKGEAIQTLAAFPPEARFENALVSYARYLAKSFWPVNLAVPYPYSSHWPAWEFLLAGLLIVGISVASLVYARKFPYVFTGWFWFLGMLVPVIGLVQVGMQSMADRYTYLPLIGVCIAVVWGAGEWGVRLHVPKAAAGIISVSVVVACSILTAKQIGYWQDSGTLFRHAIAMTSNNAEAYEHLGNYYLRDAGRVSDAIECYRQAVKIAPDRISAHVNLGSALLLERKTDDAAEEFKTALRLDPQNPEAHCDLGYIFASKGEFGGAIANYNRAIQLKPEFASAYNNRGLAFAAKGEWDKAVSDYREAIRLEPGRLSTRLYLADALFHAGKRDEAAQECRDLLKLDPNNAQARKLMNEMMR